MTTKVLSEAERPRSRSRKRRTVAVVASAITWNVPLLAPVALPDDFTGSAQPVRQPVQPPADWPTADEIDAIIGTACYGYA